VIHETAIIHPSAHIAQDVTIGPYSVIGEDVEIGEGTWIGPHVVIQGPSKIGKHNRIYQFSSVGECPQDKKYQGERTYLEMGDHNVIREFCTFNRGTTQDKAATRIGNHNLFMAYVHIAHDCNVGNHVILANNASLAGHVHVGDYANLGGFAGVFQFCRLGAHSFITGASIVVKDVPPFLKVSGHYAKPYGLNSVGLKRRGFTDDMMLQLKRAYKTIYRKGLTAKQAVEELKNMVQHCTEISQLVEFIESSASGIVR
jgi:UDP-N-acetylglucosamine acyltransferase